MWVWINDNITVYDAPACCVLLLSAVRPVVSVRGLVSQAKGWLVVSNSQWESINWCELPIRGRVTDRPAGDRRQLTTLRHNIQGVPKFPITIKIKFWFSALSFIKWNIKHHLSNQQKRWSFPKKFLFIFIIKCPIFGQLLSLIRIWSIKKSIATLLVKITLFYVTDTFCDSLSSGYCSFKSEWAGSVETKRCRKTRADWPRPITWRIEQPWIVKNDVSGKWVE